MARARLLKIVEQLEEGAAGQPEPPPEAAPAELEAPVRPGKQDKRPETAGENDGPELTVDPATLVYRPDDSRFDGAVPRRQLDGRPASHTYHVDLQRVFGFDPNARYDPEELSAIVQRRAKEIMRVRRILGDLASFNEKSVPLLEAIAAMRGLSHLALERLTSGRLYEAASTTIKAIAFARYVETFPSEHWYEEARPDPTRLWYMLGEILVAIGDGKRAAFALEEAEREASAHGSYQRWRDPIQTCRVMLTANTGMSADAEHAA